MANKIRLGRATKSRIETIKETLDNYEIVYSIDTKEIGIKNSDGTITYFGVVTELEWSNILNKPTFATVATSGAYADLTGKPDLNLKLDKNFSSLTAQANPLLTDVLVLNRGTNIQKVTLGNLLAQVDKEIFVVVSALPTTGVENKIYLVASSNPKTQNVLDEFIWADSAWERIGAVSVDLSNYFNKTEINSMLDNKVDKNANITAGTHPKITYDAKGLVTGGGALVAGDIPNLNASKINAGSFTADRIPSLSPTKITQNASNRFVTDTEKATWNGKANVSDITAVSSGLDSLGDYVQTVEGNVIQLQTGKQDKLSAGNNITINASNVISSKNDEPDGVTIVLNGSNKLSVSENLGIDGGDL